MKRLQFLLFYSFLTLPFLYSQADSSSGKSVFVIQPQLHVGKIVKIYPVFPSSPQVVFSELNMAYQTAGARIWHQNFHFPQVGLAVFYGNLGNPSVLGNSFAAIPNLAFTGRGGKYLNLQVRFGMGVSYFTRHYDALTNPGNNVIGSEFTNLTYLVLNANIKLGPHFTLDGGLSAFHASNGHYQLPNLGANIPSATLGLSYFPYQRAVIRTRDSLGTVDRKIRYTVGFGYGRHEFGSATKATGGPKYNVFQLMLYASKRYGRVFNVHAGMFFSYYGDYYDYIVNQEMFVDKQALRSCIVTVFGGNEFVLGKFGLIMQGGMNVYTPFLRKYYSDQPIDVSTDFVIYMSAKLGVQYYLFDPLLSMHRNCFIGAYIKSKSGEADFVQLAVGYTF